MGNGEWGMKEQILWICLIEGKTPVITGNFNKKKSEGFPHSFPISVILPNL